MTELERVIAEIRAGRCPGTERRGPCGGTLTASTPEYDPIDQSEVVWLHCGKCSLRHRLVDHGHRDDPTVVTDLTFAR